MIAETDFFGKIKSFFQKGIDILKKKCIIYLLPQKRWHARVAELADAHV